MQRLAGKILCISCHELFGSFFVPGIRKGNEYIQEAFKAWDVDSSGSIEKSELARVLKAIIPNFSDRDLNELMRNMDKNGNGIIEYEEFFDWVTKDEPLALDSTSFEEYVAQLMREAGEAATKVGMGIAEIQVRTDGVYVMNRSGDTRLVTTAYSSDSLQLTSLDPDEFIAKIESTEAGLVIGMNTSRTVKLPGRGASFGPFRAPQGFHISGLRVKPLERHDGTGVKDFVCGVDLGPLASASVYDTVSALLFAAEQEFMQTLREILSKAAVDVNAFGEGGATALMLAASRGCTGSMRMLLSSKANPNLADRDGWTALTYAGRCGSSSAVSALLEKGAKEEGDGGRALAQALMNSHNSAARSLLRAGFGPAKVGTFSLELTPKPEECKLKQPKISPPGGAFAHPTEVTLSSEDPGVQILYTLDGRDPFAVGKRYKEPFIVSQPRSHLRVVAVQGKERSPATEAIFVQCHFALPDEVVSGSLKAKIFPGALNVLRNIIASIFDIPSDRLQVSHTVAELGKGARWLQVVLKDLKPRHQLRIDQAFATVKAEDKRQRFIDSISNDIQKAVGERPSEVNVLAGSIIVDFQMTRMKAEEIGAQLLDSSSFLLTKAKSQQYFKAAKLKAVDALGQRLKDPALQKTLGDAIKGRPQMYAIGEVDEGYLALALPNAKQAAAIKKPLDQVVRKQLQDVEFTEIQEHPEELQIDYTIDVMHVGAAGDLLKALNEESAIWHIKDLLGEAGLPTPISVVTAATSRKMAEMEFRLQWEQAEVTKTDVRPIQAKLDASCFVYAEDELVRLIDFRQHLGEDARNAANVTADRKAVERAVNRAVRDNSRDAGPKEQRTRIDLNGLPVEVTDLYFVLSTFEADDLRSFSETSAALVDVSRNSELTRFSVKSPGHFKAVVLCGLTRHERGWVMYGLGQASDGNSKHYDPIVRLLNEKQSFHLNWERRKELVKLRILHHGGRLAKESTSSFAQLLQDVLNLPPAVFQLLVKWF